MKHWIILFTPETYEAVKKLGMIGVRANVWKSFSEGMAKGDRFIGYVSKKMLFDAIGTIAGDATFEERQVFPGDKLFPCRRKITFEKTGINVSAGDLFHGIAPFNKIGCGPGNYLMCKGGFAAIDQANFEWLLKQFSQKK